MAMEWVLAPKKSCGPIELKMAKTQVKEILGPKFFHKEHVYYPGLSSDWYFNRRISIGYREDQTVAQISVMRPYKAILFGMDILKESVGSVKEKLTAMNTVFEENSKELLLKNEKRINRNPGLRWRT